MVGRGLKLHEGMILDGGNRYRACLEAGVDPTFKEFDGGNLVSFVLSANLHRRHMSPGQQAAIVASAQDWGKAQIVGSNQHSPKSGSATLHYHPESLATVADRAAQSGASVRTQKMADKVAKTDPELAKKVAHGEISLPKAVESITGKATVIPLKPKSHDSEIEQEIMKDFDPLAELEEAQKEIERLQAQIKAMCKDDLAKQIQKEVSARQGIEARLAQEMDRANRFDTELRKYGRFAAELRKMLRVETNAQVIARIKSIMEAA